MGSVLNIITSTIWSAISTSDQNTPFEHPTEQASSSTSMDGDGTSNGRRRMVNTSNMFAKDETRPRAPSRNTRRNGTRESPAKCAASGNSNRTNYRQRERNNLQHPNHSSDSGNRTFFDRKIKTGEPFRAAQDEAKFFDAIIEYDDKIDLLSKLTSPNGLKILRLAICSDSSNSVSFLKSHVIKFIELLGSDPYSSGICQNLVVKLVKVLYDAPGFIQNLKSKYENFKFCMPKEDNNLQMKKYDSERGKEEIALGWFILKCCTEFTEGNKRHDSIDAVIIFLYSSIFSYIALIKFLK